MQRDPAGSLAVLLKSPVSWLLLAALLVSLFMRWRTKRIASSARVSDTESSDPQLRKIYGDYVRSLQRSGIAPQPSETEDERIARLSDTINPAIAAAATRFLPPPRGSLNDTAGLASAVKPSTSN